jgi:large conductance mechanosensitive channel
MEKDADPGNDPEASSIIGRHLNILVLWDLRRIIMTTDEEILEELRKIREAVTPKPPPPPPKGVWAEFMEFIGKAGVLGLAIGFIMGTYIGTVVTALVQDIIMPIPGALMPGGDWRKAVVSLPIGQGMNFGVGDFAGVIINFLIVAVVVFFIAKYAGKLMEKKT